jgi:hypothetical protein
VANIESKYFKDINLDDKFFDSLKADYNEFTTWFNKKSSDNKHAFTLYEDNNLRAFLYLKIEKEEIDKDISPKLIQKRRLKVGTFKIDAHGTKLGERFIKKIFDVAVFKNINEIYVTIFEKHESLIKLLTTFGFSQYGNKTTSNGVELVFIKKLYNIQNDILKDYPIVQKENKKKFVLSISPKFHTKLFSDSILHNESVDILKDTSYTNSIHKIYICAMQRVQNFSKGDLVLIYRTSDGQGSARFRSVVTSVCVIEEVLNINSFDSVEKFLKYCEPYSIFTVDELRGFYKTKKYPFIIKMTYNIAFKKRVTNGQLQDDFEILPDYWGVFDITDKQFNQIIKAGEVDESIIIN